MRFLLALTTLLLTATPVQAEDSTLRLRIEGLQSDRGHVICTLYGSAKTWLKDPGYHSTASTKPVGGVATCEFARIPAGTWAVSFIHDLNDNEDMDTGFFGLPKEPWGVSRDAPVRFGPPAFDRASFHHPSPTTQIAHPR